MKKIILLMFSITLSVYINVIPAYAEEIEEMERIETEMDIAVRPCDLIPTVSTFSTTNENEIKTDADFLNIGVYSPVLNVYKADYNSTFWTYSGNRDLLIYNNQSKIFNNGNWLFSYFYDNCYPLESAQYYLDITDNMLYIITGTFGNTTKQFYYNCYMYPSLKDETDAYNLALNTDLSQNSGATSYYYYVSNLEKKEGFYDDDTITNNGTQIKFDETGVTVTEDYNLIYVDYLIENSISGYGKPKFYRCYMYCGTNIASAGFYNWDTFEQKLPYSYPASGYAETKDNVLILGIGTAKTEGEGDGTRVAPNLQGLTISEWSYVLFAYSEYNTFDVYENETFYDSVNFSTITANTSLEELQIIVRGTGEDGEGDEVISNNPVIAFFQRIEQIIEGFTDGLSNLVSSLVDLFSNVTNLFGNLKESISIFGDVITSCFSWMPAEVADLIVFALLGACIILLVKAIKLFL